MQVYVGYSTRVQKSFLGLFWGLGSNLGSLFCIRQNKTKPSKGNQLCNQLLINECQFHLYSFKPLQIREAVTAEQIRALSAKLRQIPALLLITYMTTYWNTVKPLFPHLQNGDTTSCQDDQVIHVEHLC